jgi:hypothetical protein
MVARKEAISKQQLRHRLYSQFFSQRKIATCELDIGKRARFAGRSWFFVGVSYLPLKVAGWQQSALSGLWCGRLDHLENSSRSI